jgi:hypothetical protein
MQQTKLRAKRISMPRRAATWSCGLHLTRFQRRWQHFRDAADTSRTVSIKAGSIVNESVTQPYPDVCSPVTCCAHNQPGNERAAAAGHSKLNTRNVQKLKENVALQEVASFEAHRDVVQLGRLANAPGISTTPGLSSSFTPSAHI